MAKTIRLLALTLAGLVAVAGIAYASNGSAGSSVVLGAGQKHNGDYYAAGGNVEVAGTVNGDVYVAGGTVDVDGTVNGDVLAAGGTVTVSGHVTGSIRAAGGTLVLSGKTDRNVSVAGGTVQLAGNGTVHGNMLAAGGNISIDGPVNGDLTAATQDLTIENTVGGSVNTRATDVTLTSDAKVDGSLTYASPNIASLSPGASVVGKTTHKTVSSNHAAPNHWAVALWVLVSGLILGVVVVWLLPRFTLAAAEVLAKRPWQSLGIGFVGVIVTPVAAVILLITVLGIPLSVLLFGLFGLALLLGQIVIGLWLGRLIMTRLDNRRPANPLAFLLGALIYWLIWLIPILGGIVFGIAGLFGFGSVVQALYARRKEL